MQISISKQEGLVRNFQVIIPATDFDKNINDRLVVLGKKVKIDGFRPGKAPVAVIKQRYMGDAISHVVEKLMDQAVEKIYKEHKIRQADRPSIDVKSFEPGTDLHFTVTVETLPEIEIQSFDSIKLERPVSKVFDEEVEKKLQEEASHTDKFVPVERSAQEGDLMKLAISVELKGRPLKGAQEKLEFIIGDEFQTDILPNTGKACIGLKAGESAEVEETFKEGNGFKGAEGKTVKIKFTVDEICTVSKHAVDEDFAKDMGFETLEALRQDIRSQLDGRRSWLAGLYVKRHLLDALAVQYSFELPPKMVESEFNDIWNRLKQEMDEARAEGTLDPEDDKPEEELKREYKAIAERRIRLGLLISDVAEKNNIQLDKSDLQRALYQEVMKAPHMRTEIMKFFSENPGSLQRLSAPILEEKVVAFILKTAQVTEKEMPYAEFKKIIAEVVPGFFDDEEEEASAKQEESTVVEEKPVKAKKAKG